MRSAEMIRFAGAYPKCFESGNQYKEWKSAAIRTPRPMYGPCTDCTPEFQNLMKEQRRCENVYVKFKRFPEGGVEGFLSLKEEE